MEASGQGFKLVITDKNSTTAITQENLSKCVLKQATTWINGTSAMPVDQAARSRIRKAFSLQIHGREVSAIESYRQRQIFTGRSAPPTEAETDEEVVAFVRSSEGAVGHVSEEADPGPDVEVLEILDQ
jgi:hypothetical protein